MRVHLVFFCIGVLLVEISLAAVPDSAVAYKIGKYDIKKTEKVFSVAQKLHVDPELIVKLNKLRNIQQDLVPGQRIKIPIYAKGYKYEQQQVVIHKAVDADSAQMALLYADAEKDLLAPLPETFFDPEEDRTRLMLIEAQLELNQAMMQGLQASFDSLNVADTTKVDEKNVQAMLRRMKRSREKALLTPYLENVRDSLTQEIAKLIDAKKVVEARVNPSAPPVITRDTVVSASDTIIYATKTYADNRPSETTVATVIIKDEPQAQADVTVAESRKFEKKAKRAKQYYGLDTVIIYDLPSTAMKPAPEKNHAKQPVSEKGQWDTARAIDPLQQKSHWDTARAITSVTDSLQRKLKMTDVKNDSTVALKIKVPNGSDSIVIVPIVKKKPAPVATKNTVEVKTIDSVRATAKVIAEPNSTRVVQASAPDTTPVHPMVDSAIVTNAISIEKQKETTNTPTVIPPVKRMGVGEALLASADSVKRIKAEFFYRRYQKAMSDKNFRNAESYLHKAIELSPKYFDAWFALAEMEAMFGTQQTALKSYQHCATIDSTKPKLFISLGNLQTKMKRKSDAYNSYNRALTLNPNDVSALMARASILMDWKKYRDAIIDYDKVVQLNRAIQYAYKARGQAKFLNKDYAGAIDDYTRFLIFELTDPSAYYYRGLAKISNNELADGCMDLSNAADLGYPAAVKAIKKSCQ